MVGPREHTADFAILAFRQRNLEDGTELVARTDDGVVRLHNPLGNVNPALERVG